MKDCSSGAPLSYNGVSNPLAKEYGNDVTRDSPSRQRYDKWRDLYLSFELGDKRWTLTLSDARRGPSRYTVSAGAQAELMACIDKARTRCQLAASAPVHSCYEAGRDGWWLHRWLREQGIDNIVVDSASIEVNRRARRAKTDRLDGDKLLAMLLRHHAGERVWSVLHEPTAADEDARRAHRELERLTARAHCAHQPHRLAAGAAQPAPASDHRRA